MCAFVSNSYIHCCLKLQHTYFGVCPVCHKRQIAVAWNNTEHCKIARNNTQHWMVIFGIVSLVMS